MKIASGADHGGFRLKSYLVTQLEKAGLEVEDFGTYSSDSCDYPVFGYKVAKAVSAGDFDRGILICKSGLGMSIVANKIPGIRATLCRDIESVISSRKHNDANILVLAANFTDEGEAWEWVTEWLNTDFEGGRHFHRVNKIREIEEEIKKR